MREARIHVRHLREILRSLDKTDAAIGLEFASFSCLSSVTHSELENATNKRRTTDIKADMDFLPPDFILPGGKDVPLKQLIPFNSENQKFLIINNIFFSAFNPPPGPRKMKVNL